MSKGKGELDRDRTFGEVAKDIKEAYIRLPDYKEETKRKQLKSRFVTYSLALETFVDRTCSSIDEAERKKLRIAAAKLICCITWLLYKHGISLATLFEPFYKTEEPKQDEGTRKRHTSPDNSQGEG